MKLKSAVIAACIGGLVLAGGTALPASAVTYVTPGVTVVDECGTQYDRVRTEQRRGITYNVIDRPEDGYAIVRATPLPGYALAPEAPFQYDAHGNTATANIEYTNDLPCWPN